MQSEDTFNFTKSNLDKIHKLFIEESEYRRHMNNLYKTRKGLYTIIEARPDLEAEVMDQFKTLNLLVAALLPEPSSGYPHPPYNDSVQDDSFWF